MPKPHLFLFSTKVIYMVKLCMQMIHSLSFVWLYMQMIFSYLHGEGVHANDSLICMVKLYMQMILSHLHGEGIHANDTLSFAW